MSGVFPCPRETLLNSSLQNYGYENIFEISSRACFTKSVLKTPSSGQAYLLYMLYFLHDCIMIYLLLMTRDNLLAIR